MFISHFVTVDIKNTKQDGFKKEVLEVLMCHVNSITGKSHKVKERRWRVA